MKHINFKGNPIKTYGTLPKVGNPAPIFTLSKNDLSEVSLNDLLGKTLILNIFPSIDTPTCALSVKHFNQVAAEHPNTQVLCISADLPFAQGRFCAAEGIENVITLSSFRHPEFGENYGVKIMDPPLKGLLSRAIVIIDNSGNIIYTEHVAELTQEPNYHAALASLKN